MGNVITDETLAALDPPIIGVPALGMADILAPVVALLKKVVTPDTGFCVEAVLADLLSGKRQLWVVGQFEAIVVTHVQNRPLHRVLWVDWMAGEQFKRWAPSWGVFQQWLARDLACATVEFNGRLGYKRFEKAFETCKPVHTMYRLEID